MRPFVPVENSSLSPRGSSEKTISLRERQIVLTVPSGWISIMMLCALLSELFRRFAAFDVELFAVESGESTVSTAWPMVSAEPTLIVICGSMDPDEDDVL